MSALAERLNTLVAGKLEEYAGTARAEGKEHLLVVKRSGNSPRNWDRAQVAPGLFGRCVGPGRLLGEWLIDVEVVEVERWLERRRKRDEGSS